LENEIGNAISISNLGAIFDEENEIILIIEALNKEYGLNYKGWDSKLYPYFKYEKIDIFNIETYKQKTIKENKEFEAWKKEYGWK